MLFREEAFRCGHGANNAAQRISQFHGSGFRTGGAQAATDQDSGFFVLFDKAGDSRHGCIKRFLV